MSVPLNTVFSQQSSWKMPDSLKQRADWSNSLEPPKQKNIPNKEIRELAWEKILGFFNPNKTSQFSELLQLVQKADPSISFFGNRYVSIAENGETIDLDILVSRMQSLLSKNREFTEYERNDIKLISKKLNSFYKITDEQMESSNIITRIIYLFRESIFGKIIGGLFCIGFIPSRARWPWQNCRKIGMLPNCDMYKFYTPTQFLAKFWYQADKENESIDFYEDYDGLWFCPRKNQDQIRKVVTGMDSNYWDFTTTLEPKKAKDEEDPR